MTAYIIRRILFMVPTILGIMLVSFLVVQFAPGGIGAERATNPFVLEYLAKG